MSRKSKQKRDLSAPTMASVANAFARQASSFGQDLSVWTTTLSSFRAFMTSKGREDEHNAPYWCAVAVGVWARASNLGRQALTDILKQRKCTRADVRDEFKLDIMRKPFGAIKRSRRTNGAQPIGRRRGEPIIKHSIRDELQQRYVRAGLTKDVSNMKLYVEPLYRWWQRETRRVVKERRAERRRRRLEPASLEVWKQVDAAVSRIIKRHKTKNRDDLLTLAYVETRIVRELAKRDVKATDVVILEHAKALLEVLDVDFDLVNVGGGVDDVVVDPTKVCVATFNTDKSMDTVLSILRSDAVDGRTDVCLVTETNAIAGRFHGAPTGYSIVYGGRCNGKGGGVAILARKNLCLRPLSNVLSHGGGPLVLPASDPNANDASTIETGTSSWLWSLVTLPNDRVLPIVVVYLPPSLRAMEAKAIVIRFGDDLTRVAVEYGAVLVGGDLNCDFVKIRSQDSARRDAWLALQQYARRQGIAAERISSDESSFVRNGGSIVSSIDSLWVFSRVDPSIQRQATYDVGHEHRFVCADVNIDGLTRSIVASDDGMQRVAWQSLARDNVLKKVTRVKLESLEHELVKAHRVVDDDDEEVASEAGGAEEPLIDLNHLVKRLYEIGIDTIGVSKGGRRHEVGGVNANGVVAGRREGTRRRQREVYWNRDLSIAANEAKRCRRRLERANQNVRKWRSHVELHGGNERGRSVAYKRLLTADSIDKAVRAADARRIETKDALSRFELLNRTARALFYDIEAAKLDPSNPLDIADAHATIRRLARSNSPGMAHSRAVLEATWRDIFEGKSGQAPTHEALLRAMAAEAISDDVCNGEQVFELTADEVVEARSKLANNKSPGGDGVANEILKLIVDEHSIEFVRSEFNRIINDPTNMPGDWKRGLVSLIPKKNDPTPSEYRPITLLTHIAKWLETSVLVHLQRAGLTESLLPFEATGFRESRGTEEAIFSLLAANERASERGVPLVAVFLDIRKAYDSVPFDVLTHSLARKEELPRRLVRFMSMWVMGHERRLIVPGEDGGEWLPVRRGVPQGSVLAPFMFACVMDTLSARMRGEAVLGLEACDEAPGVDLSLMNSWRLQMYADDTALAANSVPNSQVVISRSEEWSMAAGLRFAPDKCEVLRMGARVDGDDYATINGESMKTLRLCGETLPVVKQVKYLGVTIDGCFDGNPPMIVPDARARAVASFVEKASFVLNVKREGNASTRMAAHTMRPVIEGKLYAGVSVAPLNVVVTRKAVAKGAKAALGVFVGSSSTRALSFIGWKEPKRVEFERMLGLLLRVCRQNQWPELRELAEGVVAGDVNRGGVGGAWLQRLHRVAVGVFGDVDLLFDAGWPVDWRTWFENDDDTVRDKWKKKLLEAMPGANCQHPIVMASPENAQCAYRMTLPSLKPYEQSTKDEPDGCELCSGHENNGFELLANCLDVRVREIVGEFVTPQSLELVRAAVNGDSSNLNVALRASITVDCVDRVKTMSCVEELVEVGNGCDVLLAFSRAILLDRLAKKTVNEVKLYFSALSEDAWAKSFETCDEAADMPTIRRAMLKQVTLALRLTGLMCRRVWKFFCASKFTAAASAMSRNVDLIVGDSNDVPNPYANANNDVASDGDRASELEGDDGDGADDDLYVYANNDDEDDGDSDDEFEYGKGVSHRVCSVVKQTQRSLVNRRITRSMTAKASFLIHDSNPNDSSTCDVDEGERRNQPRNVRLADTTVVHAVRRRIDAARRRTRVQVRKGDERKEK